MSDSLNSSGFPQLEPGAVFAKQFKLIEPAGRGGFGEVWKAWDIAGCRNVALKFIGPDLRDDIFVFLEEGVGVFKNFQDTQSLNHQHICPIYGLLPSNYGPFLYMKWLDGESLKNRQNKYLRQGKLIPHDQVHKILLDIAEALDYAHSRGIVHRDVKPDNIFLERFKDTEDAVLLDFGLADVIQETLVRTSLSRSQSTTGNHFGGTYPYMAPEQWRGSHHLNGRTDQYALGVVAYELLSGKRPFDISYLEILRQAVLNEIPETIDGISTAANTALQTALSKKKEERFYSCREFVLSLELDTAPVTTSPNNPEEQNELGIGYYFGKGVEQDYGETANWFLKAAKQGSATAQYSLGLCYYYGNGVSQNYNKAFERFQKAAEQGNADAQYCLGLCYYYGNGVSQNYNKAIEWFQKAADQGNADAQNKLRLCKFYGNGMPPDYIKAAEQNKEAAKQGDAEALYEPADRYKNRHGALKTGEKAARLGYKYYHGNGGVRQDYKKAVEMFKIAANQGVAKAQCTLGVCYENGLGVPKDKVKALEWYRKAVNQGYDEARDGLNRLSGQ